MLKCHELYAKTAIPQYLKKNIVFNISATLGCEKCVRPEREKGGKKVLL